MNNGRLLGLLCQVASRLILALTLAILLSLAWLERDSRIRCFMLAFDYKLNEALRWICDVLI